MSFVDVPIVPTTTGSVGRPRCRVAVIVPTLIGPESVAYNIEWFAQKHLFAGDIMSCTTQDDLSQSWGSFSLQVAPRTMAITGSTWADLIPINSVVAIEMQRDPERLPLPLDDDPMVMIGLVKQVVLQEDHSGPQPTRMVTISGKDLGCVLSEGKIYYNPFIDQKTGDPGGVAAQGVIQDPAFAVLGKLSWAPNLVEKNHSPTTALTAVLQKFIFNDATGVINLALPAPLVIEDLLTMGICLPTPLHWGVLDPTMVLPAGDASPLSSGVQLPIWSYMQRFMDEVFHECFTRCECGTQVIHFRPRPFSKVPSPTSQFEPHMTLRTHFVDEEDIISQTTVRRDEVFNLFYVQPAGSQLNTTDVAFKEQVPPVICGEPTSPSYVGRFGLRPMEVQSAYMGIGKSAKNDAMAVTQAQAWATILKSWYEKNPVFRNCSMTLPGRGSYKKGNRLVVSRGGAQAGMDREYYIEGVSQSFDLRSGSFTTSLRLTRGWDIPAEAIPETWANPVVNPMAIYFQPNGLLMAELEAGEVMC